jgi:hypothetical protein
MSRRALRTGLLARLFWVLSHLPEQGMLLMEPVMLVATLARQG